MNARRGITVAVLLAAYAFSGAEAQLPGVTPLDAVHSLGLDSATAGRVTVFYRPADRVRALDLSARLQKDIAFIGDSLNLRPAFRLAVLGPTDWPMVTPLPYGFPNSFGPPANLILATAQPGPVDDVIVVLHEAGHVFINTLAVQANAADTTVLPRLNRIPEWYWEFLANYFAVSYLTSTSPADIRILGDEQELLMEPKQRFTRLDDWFTIMMKEKGADGRPYFLSGTGIQNFGWFQHVTAVMAAHVRARQGMYLLRHLFDIPLQQPTPATRQIIEKLDQLAPGLSAKLDQLGAVWR